MANVYTPTGYTYDIRVDENAIDIQIGADKQVWHYGDYGIFWQTIILQIQAQAKTSESLSPATPGEFSEVRWYNLSTECKLAKTKGFLRFLCVVALFTI